MIPATPTQLEFPQFCSTPNYSSHHETYTLHDCADSCMNESLFSCCDHEESSLSAPFDSEVDQEDSLIVVEEPSCTVPVRNNSHSYKCCNFNCIYKFSEHKIEEFRNFFHSKTTSEQNQFLLNLFQLISDSGSIQHTINGKSVCKNAYIRIFKISEKRYNRIFKLFQRNPTTKINRKPTIRHDSIKVRLGWQDISIELETACPIWSRFICPMA